MTDIGTMVNRFLQWRLPDSVCSDTCVTDRAYAARYPGLRSGTNLLTAEEARQMIEHLFEGIPANESEEIERLRRCLGFFASVIKSGEPWTETCEREYLAALRGDVA